VQTTAVVLKYNEQEFNALDLRIDAERNSFEESWQSLCDPETWRENEALLCTLSDHIPQTQEQVSGGSTSHDEAAGNHQLLVENITREIELFMPYESDVKSVVEKVLQLTSTLNEELKHRHRVQYTLRYSQQIICFVFREIVSKFVQDQEESLREAVKTFEDDKERFWNAFEAEIGGIVDDRQQASRGLQEVHSAFLHTLKQTAIDIILRRIRDLRTLTPCSPQNIAKEANLRLFHLMMIEDVKVWVRSEVEYSRQLFSEIFDRELGDLLSSAKEEFKSKAETLVEDLRKRIACFDSFAMGMRNIEEAIAAANLERAGSSEGKDEDLPGTVESIQRAFVRIFSCFLGEPCLDEVSVSM
jgi:hypothetical protein